MAWTYRIVPLMAILLCAGCGQTTPAGSSTPGVLSATETSQDLGSHVVYFNALPTVDLAAEIARDYGIVRSETRALLTVSLREKQPGGGDTSAHGRIRVSATNLTGQLKSMTMTEIDEGDAVYYIGEVSITNGETLIFEIQVMPEGVDETYTIRYMRQFFVD